MKKVDIGANTFVFPMPVMLLGTIGDYTGKAWGAGKDFRKRQ